MPKHMSLTFSATVRKLIGEIQDTGSYSKASDSHYGLPVEVFNPYSHAGTMYWIKLKSRGKNYFAFTSWNFGTKGSKIVGEYIDLVSGHEKSTGKTIVAIDNVPHRIVWLEFEGGFNK